MDTRTFREAVAAVAEQARAKLPASVNGRIESAIKLVLAHDVTPQPDGTIEVGSSSDPLKVYHLVGATCDCQDFAYGKAPEGWCMHRIAAGMSKRVHQELAAAPAPLDVTPPALPAPSEAPVPVSAPALPVAPVPEMPFSVTLKGTIDGQDALLTARGMTAAEFHTNLQAIRGLLDPVRQAPAQGQPSQPDPPPQCPTHGAMKPRPKGTGWYCPRKNDDETWCKSTSK